MAGCPNTPERRPFSGLEGDCGGGFTVVSRGEIRSIIFHHAEVKRLLVNWNTSLALDIRLNRIGKIERNDRDGRVERHGCLSSQVASSSTVPLVQILFRDKKGVSCKVGVCYPLRSEERCDTGTHVGEDRNWMEWKEKGSGDRDWTHVERVHSASSEIGPSSICISSDET